MADQPDLESRTQAVGRKRKQPHQAFEDTQAASSSEKRVRHEESESEDLSKESGEISTSGAASDTSSVVSIRNFFSHSHMGWTKHDVMNVLTLLF
jgi:hypothetical protein